MGHIKCKDRKGLMDAIAKADSDPEPKRVDLVYRMLYDRRVNRYYLKVSHQVSRGEDEHNKRPLDQLTVAAVDIGASSFVAMSQPSGCHGDLIDGAHEHILRAHQEIAHLRSLRDQAVHGLEKRHYRRRELAVRAHLRNWMRNVHYDTINFLLKLGDLIIYPHLQVSKMIGRHDRVFGKVTAKLLQTFSTYKFTMRLFHKVQVSPNKYTIFPVECGSTGTCDHCGCWNPHVGGSKIFVCPCCGYTAVRDAGHGARANGLIPITIVRREIPNDRSGPLCGPRSRCLGLNFRGRGQPPPS